MPQLEVLLRGVFDKRRFLDLIRHFIVFGDDGTSLIKKVAGYHQFHAGHRFATKAPCDQARIVARDGRSYPCRAQISGTYQRKIK
jgi:type I restriction enzyme R subunit